MRPQPAEGPVQLEQLQAMPVEPPANQETREARRQEEQGADVSLVGHEKRQKRFSTGVQPFSFHVNDLVSVQEGWVG